MRINYLKSENYTFYGTKKRRIQAIVIHYTGMRTLQSAVERLLYSKDKVSSHYVISRNGKILQLVNQTVMCQFLTRNRVLEKLLGGIRVLPVSVCVECFCGTKAGVSFKPRFPQFFVS